MCSLFLALLFEVIGGFCVLSRGRVDMQIWVHGVG